MPLSPPAAANLTAAELELEITANTVSNTVAVSLAASIVVSVATTIGATIVASSSAAVAAGAAAGGAGAASGGVGGGAASTASGGGGAGGMADVTTALMAAQRLSVLALMPVDMSKIHARVGETLSWTKGSLGLFPRIVSEETRRQFWGWQPTGDNGRRLFEVGAEAESIARERNEVWLDALMGLIDTLTTLACALALVLLLQLLAHLLNRRYYALRKKTGQGQSRRSLRSIVAYSHRLSMFEQGRVLESPELPAPRTRTSSSWARPEGTPAVPSGVEDEAEVGQDSPPPLTEADEAALHKVKFRAFPRLLRWPTAPCLVCVCCLSGLLQGAFAILVTHETVPPTRSPSAPSVPSSPSACCYCYGRRLSLRATRQLVPPVHRRRDAREPV